jgi:hypothetical protein
MTHRDMLKEFGKTVGQSIYLFARLHCARVYRVKCPSNPDLEVRGYYPADILAHMEEAITRPQRGRSDRVVPWRENYDEIKRRLYWRSIAQKTAAAKWGVRE